MSEPCWCLKKGILEFLSAQKPLCSDKVVLRVGYNYAASVKKWEKECGMDIGIFASIIFWSQ